MNSRNTRNLERKIKLIQKHEEEELDKLEALQDNKDEFFDKTTNGLVNSNFEDKDPVTKALYILNDIL